MYITQNSATFAVARGGSVAVAGSAVVAEIVAAAGISVAAAYGCWGWGSSVEQEDAEVVEYKASCVNCA